MGGAHLYGLTDAHFERADAAAARFAAKAAGEPGRPGVPVGA